MHVCMYACMYTLCTYTCVYIYICICICICIYIYIKCRPGMLAFVLSLWRNFANISICGLHAQSSCFEADLQSNCFRPAKPNDGKLKA